MVGQTWDMPITACSLDCPDACTLEVTVEHGRMVKVDAAPTGPNPLTDGWICAKVKQTPALLHGPDRILTPLRRVGPKGTGQFVPITWDEALGLITSRVRSAIETVGAQSVVPYLYNSSAGMMASAGLSTLIWEQLGAAEVHHTICAAATGEAWTRTYGSLPSADPQDIRHSELIVVWGANPNVSNPHLAPMIEARRRAGTRLVVIDPRRIPVAQNADLHLALRPGTDSALAMAVAHLLERNGHLDAAFIDQWVDGADEYLAECRTWTPERAAEVCGLGAADIERFAEMYGTIRPAMVRAGWGPERNRNGGSAMRSIYALPALAGQFGQRGGGIFNSVRGGVGFDAGAIRQHVLGDAPVPHRRSINMNRLGRHLLHDEGGRVEVLFVQGSNPAATCPEQAMVLQGLAREDLFTVVHELTLTDTARYADVVLPATSMFEVDEVVSSYGAFVLQDAPATVDRVGLSRTNDEVTCALGEHLGLPASLWALSADEVRRVALGNRSLPHAVLAPSLTVQFRDVHPATRVRLVVDEPGIDRVPQCRPGDENALPLTLITPATSRTTSTMFGNLRPASPDILLHPDDATERGLSTGDTVRVTNGKHTIETVVSVSTTMRPGVAMMPKGMWCKDGFNGLTANAFAPDHLADLAGAATFNDARVEVSAV